MYLRLSFERCRYKALVLEVMLYVYTPFNVLVLGTVIYIYIYIYIGTAIEVLEELKCWNPHPY